MQRTLLGTLFPEGSKYGTKGVPSCTFFYECGKLVVVVNWYLAKKLQPISEENTHSIISATPMSWKSTNFPPTNSPQRNKAHDINTISTVATSETIQGNTNTTNVSNTGPYLPVPLKWTPWLSLISVPWNPPGTGTGKFVYICWF